MPVSPRTGTHETVFVDPSGRRRRFFHAALPVIMCVLAALIALLVSGLSAGAYAPRTFLRPAAHPCSPAPGTSAAIAACAPQFRPFPAPQRSRHS